VVTGNPQSEASRFVQAYAITGQLNYIVGWRKSLCLQVTGLPPDRAAAVTARIQAVAQSLSLRLYNTGITCGGFKDVRIVFTADAQRALGDAVAREPAVLGDTHSDTRNVKTVTRPIQAWYQTSFCGDVCGPEPLFKRFYRVFALVDTQRTANTDLATISDYLAMLVLSEPRAPDQCQALPSVIDLYAGACPGRPAPAGLTPIDLAYLKAVYSAGSPIWQRQWTRATGDVPVDLVTVRMGKLLAGATPLPAPGAKPLLNP